MDHCQPHGSTDAVPRQCTAMSKRSGQRCRKPAMKGGAVCLAHGGRTPAGVASPHFRHGRYSRRLPDRLVERFEAACADTELIGLRQEIALLDARTCELMSRLDPDANRPGEDEIWQEVLGQIERRRRLAQAEWRHLVARRQMIPTEEAMAFAAAIADVVKRHVGDPATLRAISDEIAALVAAEQG